MKLSGPGFGSMSPERRRKARIEGIKKRLVRGRENSKKAADGVCVRQECCWQAVRYGVDWSGG